MQLMGVERGLKQQQPEELREILLDFWVPQVQSAEVADSIYCWLAVLNYNVDIKVAKEL
jgi:hypothetical protein